MQLATLAPLRPGVIRRAVTAPVGTEIGLGLDESPWIGDDAENPLMESLGRDRLDHELGHARIAGGGHAPALGMTGQHDDGRERAGVGVGLPDRSGEFQSVAGRHRPVHDHDVGSELSEGLETAGPVRGFVDLARSESHQQRPQNAAHMRVVVDHEETKLAEIDSNHDAIGGAGAGSAL